MGDQPHIKSNVTNSQTQMMPEEQAVWQARATFLVYTGATTSMKSQLLAQLRQLYGVLQMNQILRRRRTIRHELLHKHRRGLRRAAGPA
jgi:hypothetical protein